jgi:beta-lactamase regulating signal transducer with metallopeptidase domain/regulation of enolase protein 1 (concanavalin A-like superfamily)
METYLTQITDYLLTQSWQIAVLVVVIGATNLALRNRSAHVRYLLWLIVLAKCLVPPLLTIPLAILPQATLPEPIVESPYRDPAIDFEMEITPVDDAPLSLPSTFAAAPQPIVADAVPRLTAPQWLGIGWIAGVTVFILAAVIKALRTELWLRRQRKPLPVKLKSEIEDLLSCFKVRTLPKVWLVEGIGQPFVWGVLRGSIYLPGNFIKVNSSENRRGVLGHELSHVLRFDTVVNLLQVISQAIFWFHPFVWWANKRIRAEREKCCDEMAIACLSAKAKDYSTAIVNILITEHKSTRPVPSLAVAGPVKNIEERIKTMTKPGKKFYKRPSLMAAMAVLLLALLSVPATFVLTARAQRAEPAALPAAENEPDASTIDIIDVPYSNSEPGATKHVIPEANLQIPDDLKPCAEVLRKIYAALKKYEKDKGSMPDWLSDLAPDYLSAEMLIWPENGPKSTPLAPEPHLQCSFGYQYSNQATSPGGGTFYRQFKDEERKIWGDVVPLVRYYVGQKCLNLSFDGRIYFSGTAWEKEIPTLSGQILTELKTTAIPVSPTLVPTPTEPRPWGPEQATGEPDTHGAGDFPAAWAPLESDKGPEWLNVDFERAVNIAALRVRESFNPGAISKVSAIVEDGREQILWEGRYPTPEVSTDIDFILRVLPVGDVPLYIKGCSGFSILQDIELQEDVVSKSIKIYLDTTRKRGWNEIDAVQLFGKDGSKQWASHATASSTHATGIIRIKVSRGGESRPASPTKIQPGGVKSEVFAFDDFDGKLGLKWDILNPDKSHYSLSKKPGALTITTQDGHFKEANADYKNVFLIDTPVPPDQDFQITTCLLAFQPLKPYNQAGLICWDDDDNYLEWIYQMMDRRGLNFNAGVEANGPTRYTYIPSDRFFEKLWLRVTKRGNSYQCASSTDGESFNVHTVEHWGDGSPKRVGLFASNGSSTHPPEVDASFDFFEVVSIAAAPIETEVSAPKFVIPEANLQIPDEMKGCAENLQAIYAALREYEKDKGRMPDWLSQLVPGYLGQATLFCPDDTSHKSRYWSDPNLPCSYCYELNPTELRGRPPRDKTMLHYKTLQRNLFGDVVPIVRCFHHERLLNLSWDGQLYTSEVMFERLFIPNYSHNMLFEAKSPEVVPSGEPQYDADLEAFILEMNRTYPFFELKGIREDWEKTQKQLRQEVQSCKSDGEFLEIVTEAILCLRDSHMWFRDAKAQLPQRPKKYYPGISFMPATNERVVVMSCLEGLDPDLKIGTIVSRINGKDARHYLEEQAKVRWAEGGISGPQRAKLFAYRIPICGEKKGEKHTITIIADGKQRQVELSSDMEAGGWPHWYNQPGNLKQVGSCSYTILPSGIGYIYLRRIDGNTGPGMKEAFSTYPEAKGWIIDLCGNGGGGYDQTLHEVLRALPSPLAVVIDAGCTSAGETMARDLARQGKARLFGSKTAGASSSKRIWTFPSGVASLSVPTRSRWGIDGKPIEFLGIEPHVKVEAVPEELKRGLNSAILRAEEYITEITSTQMQ